MPTKRNIQSFLGLMVASAFFLQSCATIVKGTSQKIPVTSNPPGAKIIVDGKERGFTPLTLKLMRKKNYNLRIEKEGYSPFTIEIRNKQSLAWPILGGYFLGGNLGGSLALLIVNEHTRDQHGLELMLLGALLGWATSLIIDFVTGAAYDLSPDTIIVTLPKIGESTKSNFMLIDEEHFQNIKWIRIKLSDSDRENEILSLNYND